MGGKGAGCPRAIGPADAQSVPWARGRGVAAEEKGTHFPSCARAEGLPADLPIPSQVQKLATVPSARP